VGTATVRASAGGMMADIAMSIGPKKGRST
jgi:hypothetical protein